jgi:hypothetical protein
MFFELVCTVGRSAFKALPARVAENEPIIVFLVPQKLADKYKYQKLDPPKAPFNKWRNTSAGWTKTRYGASANLRGGLSVSLLRLCW